MARDYGKVSSSFWTGTTGRSIRGDADAQLVALYLLTAPGASMCGVFYCPIAYISNDVGIPFEGASKGLRRLCEEGWCSFDEEHDLVWVHEMARYQIGSALKINDKQVIAVQKAFSAMPKCMISNCFFLRYREDFHLKARLDLAEYERALQAPSEALRSQEQEQELEQEHKRPIQQAKTSKAIRTANMPAFSLGQEAFGGVA
ncbi:hypothetical protein DBIPINDM_001595 [Mesorhizobium sp. AR02]|uniref:hypothetical protein n=1 Tax=Mesorhizobium sp. AR02 TaxID=2865837 RepID=UPI00215E7643|nr:hypothetical protein [Mesorhizobium sp. AR02]UVK55104.1 hypothetical protein DBIPINDM_001595 [Mesorhizobium sp. AR02]